MSGGGKGRTGAVVPKIRNHRRWKLEVKKSTGGQTSCLPPTSNNECAPFSRRLHDHLIGSRPGQIRRRMQRGSAWWKLHGEMWPSDLPNIDNLIHPAQALLCLNQCKRLNCPQTGANGQCLGRESER